MESQGRHLVGGTRVGLLRQNEREQVEQAFRSDLGADLRVVEAQGRFLEQLAGIEDPEEKRRRIGHTFIDVFEEAAGEVDGDGGFINEVAGVNRVVYDISSKPPATIEWE